jgi:hypothetical protein|tara:strand:- start:231 stop:452 length:222 start_codon:yes stop_codon:yes gene_type:complete
LLSQSNSDIIKYLKEFDNEVKNLKLELMKICWFMRGGITWKEVLNLSPDDRAMVGKLVKENLETTKKTGQPFF